MSDLHTINNRHVSIIFGGRRIPWDHLMTPTFTNTASADLKKHGCPNPKLQRLALPVTQDDEGFRTASIHPGMYGTTKADGMILRERGQALAAATRDCLSIVIVTPAGQVGYAHGARAALAPNELQPNILEDLLNKLTSVEEVDPDWQIYLIGGISVNNFEHEPDHIDVINIRSSQHGRDSLKNLPNGKVGIDVAGLVKKHLGTYGIRDSQIFHDEICTFDSEHLGSKRREEKGPHNLLVVYKK